MHLTCKLSSISLHITLSITRTPIPNHPMVSAPPSWSKTTKPPLRTNIFRLTQALTLSSRFRTTTYTQRTKLALFRPAQALAPPFRSKTTQALSKTTTTTNVVTSITAAMISRMMPKIIQTMTAATKSCLNPHRLNAVTLTRTSASSAHKVNYNIDDGQHEANQTKCRRYNNRSTASSTQGARDDFHELTMQSRRRRTR